jgi:hypothetical protein
MKRCAVIVENRPLKDMDLIIQRHMDFLPGWDLEHVSEVQIQNAFDYNKLLASKDFWSYFEKKGYFEILIFQHDSEILREGIDEFFGYSYVGSPWKAEFPWNRPDRAGGNGGISLRNVRDHLTLTTKHNWKPELGNEDVWFTHNLPNVAPYEVCRKFGVETEFALGAMCTHAIYNYLSRKQCKQIRTQYQPVWKKIIGL